MGDYKGFERGTCLMVHGDYEPGGGEQLAEGMGFPWGEIAFTDDAIVEPGESLCGFGVARVSYANGSGWWVLEWWRTTQCDRARVYARPSAMVQARSGGALFSERAACAAAREMALRCGVEFIGDGEMEDSFKPWR